jgi:malate dehydrogenase (oxaloacetate-decarboxylating)(NADP+)
LADLAKQEVPESVKRAYGVTEMSFGREYIIPKPFDPRVLTWVAPAVAKAAMDTGVARKPIDDFDEYRRQLDVRMGRAQLIMNPIFRKASYNPKRVVFPEGEELKIIRAAQQALDAKIAHPILLGDENVIKQIAEENGFDIDNMEIVDPQKFDRIDEYANEYFKLRQRKGTTLKTAYKSIVRPNYFAAMMVHLGDADTMISGLTSHYPWTIRPALTIVGHDEKYNKVSGLYIIATKQKTFFLADTTVNIEPTSEDISDIALQAAEFVTNFDIVPRVALLSYSNFGSASGPSPEKMKRAVKLIKERRPDLIVDGEMQADTAVVDDILRENYPFSYLDTHANVLIFPNLDAGNIAYKLLARIGNAHPIGPVLLGMKKSVHVLQTGAEVNEILDMIAIAVVDAQHKDAKKS